VLCGNSTGMYAIDAHTACECYDPTTSPTSLPAPNPTSFPAPNPTSLPAPNPTTTPAASTPEGVCYSGDSHVNTLMLVRSGGSKYLGMQVKQTAIANAMPGQRLLGATSENHKPIFGVVKEVRASPASVPYVTITVVAMKGANKEKNHTLKDVLRVTEFHTFPKCNGATFPALRLEVGDCLLTVHGRAEIATIQRTPVTKQDRTYTNVFEGKTDLVAVGSVFTHALSQHAAEGRVGKEVKKKGGVKKAV